MLGDIKPGQRRPSSHDHKWFFLQNRPVFEAVEGGLFKQVDYAYFVCNSCPDTDGEPNVVKRVVEISNAQGN